MRLKTGLPPGVCNLVFGTGPKAGAAIVKHPNIPVISFTGSTATGQTITQMSAPFYKKLSLEVSTDSHLCLCKITEGAVGWGGGEWGVTSMTKRKGCSFNFELIPYETNWGVSQVVLIP